MKNLKFSFLRIISKCDKYGMFRRAIIVWDKIPHKAYLKRNSVGIQITLERPEIEEVITQYKYFVRLNLYLVEIDFYWLWPRSEWSVKGFTNKLFGKPVKDNIL